MHINIKENKYNIDINDLITIGKRANNEKRNFLFISKILGKHLEVNPEVCKAIGFLLASLKYKDISPDEYIKFIGNPIGTLEKQGTWEPAKQNKKVLVIGFCETATGLGMAVASAIENCIYQTTTREPITEIDNILSFEEEHSHATTHCCYTTLDYNNFDFDEIILVDDEITTGNSMLNLITELNRVTGIKKYSIFSVLDWRNSEQLSKYDLMCKKNNVDIKVYSLISGDINNIDTKTVYYDMTEADELKRTTDNIIDCSDYFMHTILETKYEKNTRYLRDSGRFGIKYDKFSLIENASKQVAQKISNIVDKNDKVLVMGFGEEIYIPSRIAAYLENKCSEVRFKSTTRSPIYCEEGTDIQEKNIFYYNDIKYFYYNKNSINKKYDKIILITETDFNINLAENNKFYIVRL